MFFRKSNYSNNILDAAASRSAYRIASDHLRANQKELQERHAADLSYRRVGSHILSANEL